MIDLIIMGAVGTAVDVLDFIDDINRQRTTYRCIGMLDDDPAKRDVMVDSVRVLGPLTDAARWPEARFVDALGSSRSFRERPGSIARTGIASDRFETLIHPSATVSRRSTLGHGTIIYPHVTIAANVRVGEHVIVLANSVLNHDCSIGDYTVITAGVCLSGRVTIGSACYLGTGSAVIQDACIGDRSLVGMGSTVIRDVERESVVVGTPARALRATGEEA